jgi:hypothetical protein
VDIPLPTVFDQSVAKREGTADQADLAAQLLTVAAGVAAILATGGVAIPAFALIGITAGGGGGGLASVLADLNPTTLRNQATAQFWSDVKCTLYCNLPDDGILTSERAASLADDIEAEIVPGYSEAGVLLAEIFRALDGLALSQYSSVGSLYNGDNCDICECEEATACEPIDIVWSDLLTTPVGWYSLGDISTAGWQGTPPPDWSGDYSCSRAAYGAWAKTGQFNPRIGVKVVFAEPCAIDRAMFKFQAPGSNSKWMCIAGKTAGGTVKVLSTVFDGIPSEPVLTHGVILDTPEEYIELWFMARSGTSDAITVYITECEVN